MTPLPVMTKFAERPAYWVMGDRYIVLLTAEETAGQFSLFDFEVPAGRGSPPHIHRREDETFVVVEGELEFTVAGEARRTEPADVVFGARGVAHNFRNVGTGTALWSRKYLTLERPMRKRHSRTVREPFTS